MTETLESAAQAENAQIAVLVTRAQRGDADAFTALHARFAKSVHAVLLSRLPPADADDGLQETFVMAWKRLESLREPGAVGPWLHAIARNVATDRHRARARRGKEEPLFEESARVEGAAADRGELRERVMAHLRSLPEAYRETLAMRLIEGLTGPEIAEATGLTGGSVRVNLCRGMDLLRELLKKEGWP
ncbi:MAG: sigma-70 family RNA polymerase sigma factor [Planctomycetota bacterium]